MKESKYFGQAKLMMECLPIIAQFEEFALKGGTAINFFSRDLPRLSVDIDLAYLPIEDRETSLKNIAKLLEKISQAIEKDVRGAKVIKSKKKGQKYLVNYL